MTLLWVSTANAASSPPWLATVDAEIDFSQLSCPKIAMSVLKQAGFARISQQNNTLFAAWKNGKNYRYKALIKCFPHYNLVTVTLASSQAGGLQKAKELLKKIRKKATGSSEELPLPGHSPNDMEEIPDCSDGVALVRCLSSIPDDSLEIVQDYLDKMKAKQKKKP